MLNKKRFKGGWRGWRRQRLPQYLRYILKNTCFPKAQMAMDRMLEIGISAAGHSVICMDMMKLRVCFLLYVGHLKNNNLWPTAKFSDDNWNFSEDKSSGESKRSWHMWNWIYEVQFLLQKDSFCISQSWQHWYNLHTWACWDSCSCAGKFPPSSFSSPWSVAFIGPLVPVFWMRGMRSSKAGLQTAQDSY